MSRGGFDDAPAKGPLDGMFANTNIIVLVIFAVCCGCIAFVLGLVGMLTAKDPKAKSNATLVVIISGVLTLLSLALQFTGVLAGFLGGR